MWKKLEIRGREESNLDNEWHMFSADLSETENLAEVKFAKKHGDRFMTDNDVVGHVKYMDLR